MKKIKIEDYSPEWAHGFVALRDAFLEHLNGSYKVTHVGSTAIIGMASRGIVDIDIVVAHKGDLIDLKSQLTFLGYIATYESPDQEVVYFRRSIKEVPLLLEHHSKWLPHHLTLCLEDNIVHKSHLVFKDYMMDHAEEIAAYNELKVALAHKYPKDLESYQEEKHAYIHEVLRKQGLKEADFDLLIKYQYN